MQTVAHLMPFAKEVVFVDSSASIDVIQTEMISKGVSHIPIIDRDQCKNKGLVRRKKIWEYMLKNGGDRPTLKQVEEQPLPEVELEESLASATTKLENASAVLVRGENKRYTHFISPRVVANALRRYSERFQIVEHLEVAIQARLRRIPNEDLSAVLKLETVAFDRLTFADYHLVFSKFWEKLDLDYFDRKIVLKLVNSAREYRNALMHFRLLEDDDEKLHAARQLQNLLGKHSYDGQ